MVSTPAPPSSRTGDLIPLIEQYGVTGETKGTMLQDHKRGRSHIFTLIENDTSVSIVVTGNRSSKELSYSTIKSIIN
jgi:hypothetical protein